MCNACAVYEAKIHQLQKKIQLIKESNERKSTLEKQLAEVKNNLEKHKKHAEEGRKMLELQMDEAPLQNGPHLIIDGSSSFVIPFKKSNPALMSMGNRFEVGLYGVGNHQIREFVNYIVPQTAISRKR